MKTVQLAPFLFDFRFIARDTNLNRQAQVTHEFQESVGLKFNSSMLIQYYHNYLGQLESLKEKADQGKESSYGTDNQIPDKLFLFE